ncbi:DNA-binding protein [Siculibacillus lacustris]|uniref:DNA-binding protein n=1 Tax=Siculibacillus lacustris TaxID=1549641 RepID=A0A4V2KUB8_9HYPH|nr:DNA-binding protein [Siculibacillus lacustris]TBW40808.1 DNA-binding protein [Siculibacillus lacustris]
MDEYLTSLEVGALLGITRAGVAQKFKAGTLTGFKLGNSTSPLRIDRSCVEAIMGRPVTEEMVNAAIAARKTKSSVATKPKNEN